MNFELFIGYFTGLQIVGGNLSFPSLIATAAVVHLLDGIMCRLFAHKNGYPTNLWMVLGFCFGVWAIVVLLFLPKKQEQ